MIAPDGSISADWIAMVLSEEASVEEGRVTNAAYLAVKIATASDVVAARAVEAERKEALAALKLCEVRLLTYVVWGRDDEDDAALRAAQTILNGGKP